VLWAAKEASCAEGKKLRDKNFIYIHFGAIEIDIEINILDVFL
jgi:hypothetical protein